MRVASGSALFRKGGGDLSAGEIRLTQVGGIESAAVVTGVGGKEGVVSDLEGSELEPRGSRGRGRVYPSSGFMKKAAVLVGERPRRRGGGTRQASKAEVSSWMVLSWLSSRSSVSQSGRARARSRLRSRPSPRWQREDVGGLIGDGEFWWWCMG